MATYERMAETAWLFVGPRGSMSIVNLIAIDPGYAVRGPGNACAEFVHGVLDRIWFARSQDLWGTLGRAISPNVVVLELPQTRRRGTGAQATAETLIKLTAEGCLLAGIYAGASGGRVELLTPSEWKGSVPKPIQHKQLWARLSPEERALLGGDATLRQILAAVDRGAAQRWPPGKSWYPQEWAVHNALDAVGLGCTYLGRIGARERQRT